MPKKPEQPQSIWPRSWVGLIFGEERSGLERPSVSEHEKLRCAVVFMSVAGPYECYAKHFSVLSVKRSTNDGYLGLGKRHVRRMTRSETLPLDQPDGERGNRGGLEIR